MLALLARRRRRGAGELRRGAGYYPPSGLVDALTPPLSEWLASSLVRRGGGLLGLRASLTPAHPLCFYLHGEAGAGKSALVRGVLPSLVRAIRRHLHPECHGALVKQTLNKPPRALALEFASRTLGIKRKGYCYSTVDKGGPRVGLCIRFGYTAKTKYT